MACFVELLFQRDSLIFQLDFCDTLSVSFYTSLFKAKIHNTHVCDLGIWLNGEKKQIFHLSEHIWNKKNWKQICKNILQQNLHESISSNEI